MSKSEKSGAKRGRPPKNGRRVSVMMPVDFARFARCQGVLHGMTCGEWLQWRLAKDYESWMSSVPGDGGRE